MIKPIATISIFSLIFSFIIFNQFMLAVALTNPYKNINSIPSSINNTNSTIDKNLQNNNDINISEIKSEIGNSVFNTTNGNSQSGD